MMKLVSYYENKYKITDHVSTTDISVLLDNNIDGVDALNEMKRTGRTPINLKSVSTRINSMVGNEYLFQASRLSLYSSPPFPSAL